MVFWRATGDPSLLRILSFLRQVWRRWNFRTWGSTQLNQPNVLATAESFSSESSTGLWRCDESWTHISTNKGGIKIVCD